MKKRTRVRKERGGGRKVEKLVSNGLASKIATVHPKLTRGIVWCRKCGREQKVDSVRCLEHGWPTCCGETMTIDSPDERKEKS